MGYRRYDGYTDASGTRWRFRRPNGWPLDAKCPDGFTCNGYRKVSKDGRIRFSGSYWTDERWYPGLVVYVGLDDPFGAQIWTVPIDPKYTPDTIGGQWNEFVSHAHETLRQQYPENVGDWNKRTPK